MLVVILGLGNDKPKRSRLKAVQGHTQKVVVFWPGVDIVVGTGNKTAWYMIHWRTSSSLAFFDWRNLTRPPTDYAKQLRGSLKVPAEGFVHIPLSREEVQQL